MIPRLPLSAATALCMAAVISACGLLDAPMTCRPTRSPEVIAGRPSPYDSTIVAVGAAEAKICYSRPYARGRLIFGGLVPFDTLWRTGANEPTIIHLSGDAVIAGLPVESGDYSIYTVPSTEQWMVVVNASTSQWGLTTDFVAPDGSFEMANSYTDEVRRREVGRAPITTTSHPYTEQFTASFGNPTGSAVELYFDWAATRIIVPLRFVDEGS